MCSETDEFSVPQQDVDILYPPNLINSHGSRASERIYVPPADQEPAFNSRDLTISTKQKDYPAVLPCSLGPQPQSQRSSARSVSDHHIPLYQLRSSFNIDGCCTSHVLSMCFRYTLTSHQADHVRRHRLRLVPPSLTHCSSSRDLNHSHCRGLMSYLTVSMLVGRCQCSLVATVSRLARSIEIEEAI
jgi:hypothetical protein